MADKVEVRFAVDEEFMRALQEKLGEKKTTDVAKTALTILNWAAEEARQGRVILSAKPDGTEVHRLATPGLTVKS
jgi:hypothetical protein